MRDSGELLDFTGIHGAALVHVGVELPTFEPEQGWLPRLDSVA